MEEAVTGFLVILMAIVVFFGISKLKSMQEQYDAHAPKETKDKKEHKDAAAEGLPS
jgi:large-conductance mechanosensitive channel